MLNFFYDVTLRYLNIYLVIKAILYKTVCIVKNNTGYFSLMLLRGTRQYMIKILS